MELPDLTEVLPGPRGFPGRDAYRAIKLVVFDVDGVLTDGRIVLDQNNVETKFFHVRDGAGISLMQKAGLRVALITGRSSPVVDHRARELKIPATRVKQGALRKLPVFEELLQFEGVTAKETAYMGDDMIDLPVMEVAGIVCCPGDAHPEIRRLCHCVAKAHGGHGGVRAICEHLMRRREDGTWETGLARYLGREP